MVVVAFLHCADFAFEPKHFGPVFAHDAQRRRRCGKGRVLAVSGTDFALLSPCKGQHLIAVGTDAAVGRRHSPRLFGDPFGEGFQHFGMIAQIAGFDELDAGMLCRNLVGEAIDAVDQNARKQEIREHDNALVGQHRDVLQARFHQREGHAGIAHLVPAKAHAFGQHPSDFGHVAIGVRVRGTAADHDKAGLRQRQRAVFGVGAVHSVLNAAGGGGDHLGINTKFAAIADGRAVLGGIGVEHRGNVVLGVHGSKQHARHRKDPVAPCIPQPVKTVADHRVRKFQIAVVDQPVGRQERGQLFGQRRKFVDGGLATRAVAANHHTGFHAGCSSRSGSDFCFALRPFSAPSAMAIPAAPRAIPATQWLCPAASTKWPGWAEAVVAVKIKIVVSRRMAYLRAWVGRGRELAIDDVAFRSPSGSTRLPPTALAPYRASSGMGYRREPRSAQCIGPVEIAAPSVAAAFS